jgi:hypothetical protein
MPENIDVPEGLVKIEPWEGGPPGWWHVMIGRADKVKNSYLRDTEARQLRDLLISVLPE